MQTEYLHAYWRMPYIKEPNEQPSQKRSNPFPAIAESEDEETSLLLYRSATSFIVMNKFPYNAGHLLVVPYREAADIEDLNEEEYQDLSNTVRKAKKLLRLALQPDGFNIGYNIGAPAGAGIPQHVHCHIVPRWTGDTNFMPVIGNTKVLPEAMKTMWRNLRSHISQIEDSP